MTRLPWTAALAALTLLAGCSDMVGKPAATFDKVLDAYVAGDRDAMSAATEVVEAEAQAAKALPEWDTACTAEAVAARRAIITALVVEGLDQSPVMSMTDLARLGNLEAVARGRGKSTTRYPPEPRCEKRNQLGTAQDLAERFLLIKALKTRMVSWRGQLQAKYGSEYPLRRKEADLLLRRHGYATVGSSR